MIDLSLTSAALEGEPWRLWTGHLVHWGMGHLATNVVALLPPLLLLRRGESLRSALLLFLAAPLVSMPILGAGFDPYRGASGLVIGFWCAAAMILASRREPVPALAFLTLVAAKLALEASSLPLWSHEGFIVAPIAHQAGAVVGTAIGMALFSPLSRPSATLSPLRRARDQWLELRKKSYRILRPGMPISSVSFVRTQPTTSPGTKARGR